MNQDLFPQAWLINTLLDEGFIAQKSAELAQSPVPCDLTAWMDMATKRPEYLALLA